MQVIASRFVPGFCRTPPAALGRCAEQVQALIDDLQALAYRMQDLIEARSTPQSQVLFHKLFDQVRPWRIGLQEILFNLSQQPEAADFAEQTPEPEPGELYTDVLVESY